MKKEIFTPNAPKAIGPYSQAIEVNGVLFMSGQIALDPVSGGLLNETIEQEATQVLENVKAILVASGYTFANVVKASIFLKDMNDFQKINEVYNAYFQMPYPARETVEVSRLPKDARVEISVIAYK